MDRRENVFHNPREINGQTRKFFFYVEHMQKITHVVLFLFHRDCLLIIINELLSIYLFVHVMYLTKYVGIEIPEYMYL